MQKTVNPEMRTINAYQKLKDRRMREVSRPFMARGVSVQRCKSCLLWDQACICHWRPEFKLEMDFVLIYHRDELFKPTNTGRLIADVFPNNTHAFLWDRTEPEEALVNFLKDESRYFVLVFPDADSEKSMSAENLFLSAPVKSGKTITLLLLDGTWRQGRKMSKASWLSNMPRLNLGNDELGEMTIRSAVHQGMLSTAEAAALCLAELGCGQGAHLLKHYFKVFDLHYAATRSRVLPNTQSDHHLFLRNFRRDFFSNNAQ